MSADGEVSRLREYVIKLIGKENGASEVINVLNSIFTHKVHDESKMNMTGKKKVFRDFHNRNYTEHHTLLDHARWYPGLIVYHPYKITQSDMMFLTEECNNHGLKFSIDGSTDRVLGYGVRLIIYDEDTTPQQKQRAKSW
tara:strand:+ start:135 stop:554 length:420 start_codon:yes stop_codon:yes gene_type:complete